MNQSITQGSTPSLTVGSKYFSKWGWFIGLELKANVLYKSIASKNIQSDMNYIFKKYLITQDRSGCNRSAREKRELSRENAYYKRGCFIHVTCNMNAKGQAWNENI